MQRCYFDTSVLVAAAVAQHPHHYASLARLKDLRPRRQLGFTSAHSLAEFYSVLTRTPFKPPLHPSEVWRLCESVVLSQLELVSLSSVEAVEVTRNCSVAGWTGGKVHDAMHLRCALKAQCTQIFTNNLKDFRALAGPDLVSRVIAP